MMMARMKRASTPVEAAASRIEAWMSRISWSELLGVLNCVQDVDISCLLAAQMASKLAQEEMEGQVEPVPVYMV